MKKFSFYCLLHLVYLMVTHWVVFKSFSDRFSEFNKESTLNTNLSLFPL